MSTPPLATLSFRNPGPDLARVLFICAPPYPADDADTAGLDRHRALGPDELRAAVARVCAVRAEVDARFAAQLAGLEALLGRAE